MSIGAAITDGHMHLVPDVVRPSGVASLTLGRIRDEDGRIVQLMPPSFERSRAPAEVALATMDLAGVDRALLVGGATYGLHDDYIAGVIDKWPNRFTALTTYRPFLGAKAADDLERRMEVPGVLGLKLEMPDTRRIWGIDVDLLGVDAMRTWERCASLRGILMLHLNPGARDCAAVLAIADQFPDLRIVIAHLGQPPTDGWREQVRLARHPGVYLDCSALAWFFQDEEYPFPSGRDALVWAVHEVGADKVMWGSDFPSNLMVATYDQILHLVTRCDALSEAERVAVTSGTAQRLLGR